MIALSIKAVTIKVASLILACLLSVTSYAEIRDYMQDRYGDFISYKPPMRPSTWILWFFPPLLLLVLIVGWFWQSKRRQVVARGQNGVTVNSTAALTSAEKAELDRLLSQAESVDHDITSLEDKK